MIPIDGVGNKDCLRACIASLLEISLRDVPHFVQEYPGRWHQPLDGWLFPRGLTTIKLKPAVQPWCYHIGIGKCHDGVYHAVVMYADEIVHDPSPEPAFKAPRKIKASRTVRGNPMRQGLVPTELLLIVPIDIGRMRVGNGGPPL